MFGASEALVCVFPQAEFLQLGTLLERLADEVGNLGSIVELSQAQLNLTSAQIANTTATYDYQVQRVLVDYQAGVLL